MAAKAYRVLVGMNYPPLGKGGVERRVERDDVVDDLPPKSVGWLVEQGYIEAVKD